jgi:hypothetical protein
MNDDHHAADVLEVVQARRFELVDHAGRVLAVLEARDEAHGGARPLRSATRTTTRCPRTSLDRIAKQRETARAG